MLVIPAASGLTLDECMARVVDIVDKPQLLRYLRREFSFWSPTEDNVTVKPYCKDERNGWDTHVICIDGKAALFSDGPLKLEGSHSEDIQ
jgi:hypothetical protein